MLKMTHDASENVHVQVRIRADPSFTKWDVEIAAPPTFSRVHKLAPLFGIIFRRSSCQHPVLAGALGDLLPRYTYPFSQRMLCIQNLLSYGLVCFPTSNDLLHESLECMQPFGRGWQRCAVQAR